MDHSSHILYYYKLEVARDPFRIGKVVVVVELKVRWCGAGWFQHW